MFETEQKNKQNTKQIIKKLIPENMAKQIEVTSEMGETEELRWKNIPW